MSSTSVSRGRKSGEVRPDQNGGKSGSEPTALEFLLSVCLDCGTPLPAKLLELARLDLMLLTDRPLRYGTCLQLAIFSDLISAVTQNRAMVHWCRPHLRGWQIGAFLTQPLPERLTNFLWHDLRTSLRYDCNWKAWIRWETSGQVESVRIQNYSIGGFRMLTQQTDCPVGSFSLFGSTGTREKAVLNGRVEWHRQSESGWQVGCLIQGQRGRDLPRMFGNLAAVHAESQDIADEEWQKMPVLNRWDIGVQDRFPAPDSPIRDVVDESVILYD